MHELGITRNIVSIVREHAKGNPVKRVSLEIGKLAAVAPEAIRFCFDVCAQNTELAGARLEIVEIPGTFLCRACGSEIQRDGFFEKCHCGSTELDYISGDELKVKELELV